MDEQEDAVKSIEGHDCVASQGGSKHAIAFLMWIHCRESLSMHPLVLKYKEKSCDRFLEKTALSDADVYNSEKVTRTQHDSTLWHELRYDRITASRAFEFSRSKTNDGTLITLISGGKLPDILAMKRGRILEDQVRKTVSIKLGKKINKCGLILSKIHPMIAGSPDGICEDSIIEIKCPMSAKPFKKYICDGKPTQKFYVQVQLQTYLTGLKKVELDDLQNEIEVLNSENISTEIDERDDIGCDIVINIATVKTLIDFCSEKLNRSRD
ncbi:hypothetical protein EVAR_48379_1 [Eumeta japonica]|uniref:YqaJ viral recombinase domain-containing protein n=1 Tax=Eumeta variegata TaxID=151549 RepID=A0A4C1ZCF8_EUMVA|nr:hypothetical protein EVAR_48379_1 [Eumeta japonica]